MDKMNNQSVRKLKDSTKMIERAGPGRNSILRLDLVYK